MEDRVLCDAGGNGGYMFCIDGDTKHIANEILSSNAAQCEMLTLST